MRKTIILFGGYLITTIGLAAMAAEPGIVYEFDDSDSSHCDSGCGGRRKCWSPMPLGACLRASIGAQIDNGTASGLVLYRCDFCGGCSPTAYKLNATGQRRLSRMAGLMQHCAYHQLMIESSGRPDLDAARRNYVLSVLAGLGVASPAEWVVVGRPDFPMLSGEEAILIHEAMLDRSRMSEAKSATSGPAAGIPLVPMAPAAPAAQ